MIHSIISLITQTFLPPMANMNSFFLNKHQMLALLKLDFEVNVWKAAQTGDNSFQSQFWLESENVESENVEGSEAIWGC